MATMTRDKNEIRMPPQNLEAEISALGSLMLDKDAVFNVVDVLKATDFYRPVHQEIYAAMLDLFARHEPIDVLSVTTRLREKEKLEEIGGSSYLTTLVNSVPTASNVGHYAEIVKRKRLLRDLIDASHHIAQLGYKEAEDVEELLDEAEQKIFGIAQNSLHQEFFVIRDALEEAWERIDRIHREHDALRGVTTGFKDLDDILGGLQRSDFIVLAARPSLGKTALALNIARNAAAVGHSIGIFSLEMSREQLVDRLLASEAGVDLWRLRTGKMTSHGEDNDFTRIQAAMETLSGAQLYLDDFPSPTVMQLRAKARRLQAQHKLDLVVIDYLQLIKGHGAIESRVQEVSEISRSLKSMAKELHVPVLALSQLSRGVEMRPDARPKLSDLRESGCLAGDTLLMRADTGELIPIKKLVGQTNVPIVSLNNSWKLGTTLISNVFSSGYKQLFQLKTRSGRHIKASCNHPFLTINGWQRLDTLNTGNHIALPRVLDVTAPRNELTDDEIILLAHLIGDGCVLPRQPIHYTSADQKNLDIVALTAKNLFNIKLRVVQQKNWFHVYLPSPLRLARGRHHPITTWFRELGLKPVRSYEKRLPEKIFSCSEGKIALCLHHLWATDGNISFKELRGRKTAGTIYYSTTSSVLAEQVQHLLLRLGIASTLRVVPQKKYRPSYQVHIQGSKEQLRFCTIVGSYGARGDIVSQLKTLLRDIVPNPNVDSIPNGVWKIMIEPLKTAADLSWRDFSEKINIAYSGSALFKSGLSRDRMTRVAEALKSPVLLQLAQSDVYWDEIVSITSLGVEEVFDATVPETHNFIANDFVVHNSIEQDADVVMFIYREDKVRENSDKKNIAKIMIEKHRNGPQGSAELYFDENTATFRALAKHFEEPQGYTI